MAASRMAPHKAAPSASRGALSGVMRRVKGGKRDVKTSQLNIFHLLFLTLPPPRGRYSGRRHGL